MHTGNWLDGTHLARWMRGAPAALLAAALFAAFGTFVVWALLASDDEQDRCEQTLGGIYVQDACLKPDAVLEDY